MPNYLTINDPVNKGCTKTDCYNTLEKAEARIIELNAIGFMDAFIIDNDATAVNGVLCSHTGTHWIADPVKKTVTLNRASLDVETNAYHMEMIREHRNGLLAETDWTALGDVTMSDAMKTYRQMLRDIPASNTVYEDVDWGTKP